MFPTKISFRSAQLWIQLDGRCSIHVRAESASNNGSCGCTGLASKPIILEPQSRVCFLGVFWDVGQRSVPWWEDGVEDVLAKGLRSRQVRARASILTTIVASATMRVVAMASLLPRIVVGTPTGVERVARVMVEAKTFMH